MSASSAEAIRTRARPARPATAPTLEGERPAGSLLAWARERFPLGTWGPLALFLALAVRSSVRDGLEAHALLRTALAALALLLPLRLLDDLASLAADRRDHPERALSRARDLGPFHALAAVSVLGALAIASALGGAPAFALRGALAFALALALTFAPGRHARLLKYPALVLALGGAPVETLGIVWLTFTIHEVLHDARASDFTLGLEAVVLAAIAALASPVLFVVVASALVVLVERHRARAAPGLWCRAVFLVGALEVIACRP